MLENIIYVLSGVIIGVGLMFVYLGMKTPPEVADDNLVGFDPMIEFHKQLQVECPEGHARTGEFCDVPGLWICLERFKEAEVVEWMDAPLYDVELGIDEPLNHNGDGVWVEVEIQNDCGSGCKIYEHSKTGRRALAHNSAYGCKRSFNMIQE